MPSQQSDTMQKFLPSPTTPWAHRSSHASQPRNSRDLRVSQQSDIKTEFFDPVARRPPIGQIRDPVARRPPIGQTRVRNHTIAESRESRNNSTQFKPLEFSGFPIGITLYRAILRFSDRDTGLKLGEQRYRHTILKHYNTFGLSRYRYTIYSATVLCALPHKTLLVYTHKTLCALQHKTVVLYAHKTVVLYAHKTICVQQHKTVVLYNNIAVSLYNYKTVQLYNYITI